MEEKQCSKCKELKLLDNFHIQDDKPRSWCKECMNEYKKLYRKNNPDKSKEEKSKYYIKYKNDPIYILKKRFRQRIYHYVNGNNKSKKTADILGCSYEDFKLYIESKFTEGMFWERMGEIHIDHIIPLSIASTPEEVYELSHYTNLQPLWAKDNLIKHSKLI